LFRHHCKNVLPQFVIIGRAPVLEKVRIPRQFSVGRYEGDLNKDDFHGLGKFTSTQGGWTYSDNLERDRPTEGELVKVTYVKDCVWIQVV